MAAMGRSGRVVPCQCDGAAVSWISGDQFLNWGWRVPFWLSIVMVGIGLYIRLGILETPTFTRIVEEKRVEPAPVIEVLKWQPKLVALTALARMGQQGPFYIFAAFVFTYGTTVLHSSRDLLLAAVMCATALSAVTTPLAGHLSDRFGRKRMYIIGIASIGVFYLRLLRAVKHGHSCRDLRCHHPVLHSA
jgi:MFS family permease